MQSFDEFAALEVLALSLLEPEIGREMSASARQFGWTLADHDAAASHRCSPLERSGGPAECDTIRIAMLSGDAPRLARSASIHDASNPASCAGRPRKGFRRHPGGRMRAP
ncbi:hypothetical protein QZM22_25250 [Burkholderia oklahomensis]|nr:hypothetical protein [Burkholderia oklahomensis]